MEVQINRNYLSQTQNTINIIKDIDLRGWEFCIQQSRHFLFPSCEKAQTPSRIPNHRTAEGCSQLKEIPEQISGRQPLHVKAQPLLSCFYILQAMPTHTQTKNKERYKIVTLNLKNSQKQINNN